MNSQPVSQGREQRRIKYIDQRIQMWLIIALVLLEITIVLLGTGYLYLSMDRLLEQQIYSIHSAGKGLYINLFELVGYVLVAMTFVNLLALFAADRLWSGHVRSVSNGLELCLERISIGDLRSCDADPESHPTLERLASWRRFERARMRETWEILSPLLDGEGRRLADRERAGHLVSLALQRLPVIRD